MEPSDIHYFLPTRYHQAPFKTFYVCKNNDDDNEQIFLQTSLDESQPLWESAASILLKAYKDEMRDFSFILKTFEKIKEEQKILEESNDID